MPMTTSGSDSFDDSSFQVPYDQYGVAVYSNLLTRIVYGEGKKNCRYSSKFLNHFALHMITGAYIMVYMTSVYILL
jgi:hypothetical protein